MEMSPDCFIDKFLDAVHAKFNFPNYLKDIPAAVLKVYRDKDAFGTLDGLLKVGFFISNFGASENQALYVLVPSGTDCVDRARKYP